MIRDLRLALRSLARAPGFTAVAVLTIGLGVGASTAIYSVVDAVLFEPFPYQDADRIVALNQVAEETGALDGVSVANAMDWRDRLRSVTSLATMEPYGVDFMGPDGPAALDTWLVTEEFFQVMGVPAMLGRTLVPADYREGRDVIVIGYGEWQVRFGGDPTIVGTRLSTGDGSLEIVGVMPPEFDYPRGRGVWAPVRYDPARAESSRGAAYLEAVARLAPGVTVEQAKGELETVMGRLREEHPAANAEYSATLVPLPHSLVGPVRPALLVLQGAAALLLLIATANVANLMLARAADRSRLTAIRAALGASRWRLARHAFAESLALGALGGAVGVLVANGAVEAIIAFAPADLPRVDGVGVDGTVLAFAAAASLVMVLLFGLAPAIRFFRSDPRLSVGAGSVRGASSGPVERRSRHALVAAQVALAVVLLTGAGLVVRSFIALTSVERGYETENVVAATVQAWGYFQSGDERTTFVRDAVGRLGALPGVRSAGVTSALPLDDPIGNEDAQIEVVGHALAQAERPHVHSAAVGGDYFGTLGIPLRAGRAFDERDRAGSAPVVVVNETLARRYLNGEDPVGRQLRISGFWGPAQETEIVGVVADVRTGTLEEPAPPTIYLPHGQAPTGALTFVVRTAGDAVAALRFVRETLWEFNGRMPVEAETTLDTLLSDSLRTRRFHLFLLGSFALVALLLAGIGIYGVVSYTTRQRTREIGIRIALGATAREITSWVVGRGAIVVGIGLVAGLLATLPLGRAIGSMLYGIEPLDLTTRMAVAVVLGGIGLLATLLPARAASRVDPTESIRVE